MRIYSTKPQLDKMYVIVRSSNISNIISFKVDSEKANRKYAASILADDADLAEIIKFVFALRCYLNCVLVCFMNYY